MSFNSEVVGLNENGPFSVNKAISEAQPGPPVNQNTNGSVLGDVLLLNNQ